MVAVLAGRFLSENLTDNIKCGNSLIANDYYKDKQMVLGENPDTRPINAFDWDKEFPWVNEPEKFSAVVGNRVVHPVEG